MRYNLNQTTGKILKMMNMTHQLFNLNLKITSQHRRIGTLLGVWILAMISVPIQTWVWGETALPRAITIGLFTQFIAVAYITNQAWGLQRTALTFVAVAVMTWFAEFIGSSTGLPFGEYNYTDILQPQFGHVPLIIPIAWFMMLPPAWVVAQSITRFSGQKTIRQHLIFASVSALALTAWDLFLDPQMVNWNFWIWDYPVGYFGIPWINYFGWFLTAFIVTMVVRPIQLPVVPLLVVYGVVWFLQSFGQFFFWNQQGPAIVGFVVMGFFLFIAIQRYREQIR